MTLCERSNNNIVKLRVSKVQAKAGIDYSLMTERRGIHLQAGGMVPAALPLHPRLSELQVEGGRGRDRLPIHGSPDCRSGKAPHPHPAHELKRGLMVLPTDSGLSGVNAWGHIQNSKLR